MKTGRETIRPGAAKKLPCDGTFFMLLEAAFPVSVTFIMEGQGTTSGDSVGVGAGFYVRPVERMSYAVVTSLGESDQEIQYMYGDGVAGYERLFLTLAQATAVEHGVMTLTDAPDLYFPGDAARRRMIVTAHPDNAGEVALGGSDAMTYANAARRLAPGEAWVDEVAAGAPLYAVAVTAGDSICVEIAK